MNKKAVRLRSVDIINIIIMVLLLANLLFLIKIKSGPTQRKNILIDFEKLEGLKLTSSDGSLIDAAELLRNKENYILFFKLTDCPACIYSGLEQAQRLRLAGKSIVAITIHDWFDEWKAWLQNYDNKNIYLLKKTDMKDMIRSPYTPVLILERQRKLIKIDYISN